MLTINLLPPARRRSTWPLKKLALVTGGVFITLVLGIIIFNTYKIWELEQQLAALSQQYELLRPTREKMQLVTDKQRLINEKHAVLLNITAKQVSWNAIIVHFGMITPPQIWLSELSAGEQQVLLVKGNAATYPDLANFITLLEQDELLGEPVLLKAEQAAENLYTTFEMTVKIKEI